MEKIKLRPYQEDAVQAVRNSIKAKKARIVLCAPTGAGKTFIFSYISKMAMDKNSRVLICTDRVELLKQSGGALCMMGMEPKEIKSGSKLDDFLGHLYTAMVETLNRRLKDEKYQSLVASMDVIIFDEAHKQAFNKIMPFISEKTVVIGVTATPYRERNQKALDEFYNALVEVTDIPQLIQDGYLSRPLSYGVPVDLSSVGMKAGDFDLNAMGQEYSKNKVYRGVIENYLSLTPNKKAITFASNIKSSQELTFRMQEAGINAKHLDSKMGKYERNSVLAWFHRTKDAVLNNVGILTTGFDCPEIEVVILYRATTSLPLFLQMVGRGSRIAPGKDEFTILDFGENIQRLGFWETPRVWSLEKAKKKKKEQAAPVKNCPSCKALVFASARICGYCDHEFEFTKEEEDQETISKLALLTPRERRSLARGASIEEKVAMAKSKLIKPYWVLHNLKSIEEAKFFAEKMGWNWRGWWYHNKERFPNLQKEGS
jgi:superfamily II DNA or RNA helicase